MFNSYHAGDTNIKVNAVSGTIVKNYRKSFFMRFKVGSNLEDKLFSANPEAFTGRYEYGNAVYKPAVVIQSMIIGDGIMVAEVMWKEDFDSLFEDVGKKCEE